MRIPVDIDPMNKKLVTVQPKIAYKLELQDHLWLPFLDQHQLEIVVFEIITFQIYNKLVQKWNME